MQIVARISADFAVFAAIAALTCSAAAAGPSFSCARAATPDERAICRSPALSAADRQLSAYFRAIQRCTMMGGRGDNIEDQRSWLQARARCGSDMACLSALYRVRNAEFAPRAAAARRYMKAEQCPHPL